MHNLTHSSEILLVQTRYVHTLLDMLSKIDANIHPYIEQAGLPENILTTSHRYIPEVPVRNLIEIIASKSSDEEFQYLSWQACKTIFIPSIVKQIKKAKNVEEALIEFIQLMKIEAPNSRISLQEALGKVWFTRHKYKSTKPAKWYELSEQFSVIYMIELIRTLTNSNWVPDQLSLQSDHEIPFRIMLNAAGITKTQIFTGRSFTALNLSGSVLKQKFNSQLSWGEDELFILQASNFVESLKIALPAYLLAGKLPISKAASVIGLSVRTLQRRLKELGVSYRQVLDEIQIDQAKVLLKNSTHPITAISTHLGYSSVGHFSRAFKRVTGEPPSFFRQKSQSTN